MEHQWVELFAPPPFTTTSSAHLGQSGHFGTTFYDPIEISASYKSFNDLLEYNYNLQLPGVTK